MTYLTKVLLPWCVALSAAATQMPASDITIHGVSRSGAMAASSRTDSAQPARRRSTQDAVEYERPTVRYGQTIAYGGKIRYAGHFRLEESKRERIAYRSSTGIRYAGHFRQIREANQRPRIREGRKRINYGSKIRYGRGRGYGLGK